MAWFPEVFQLSAVNVSWKKEFYLDYEYISTTFIFKNQ